MSQSTEICLNLVENATLTHNYYIAMVVRECKKIAYRKMLNSFFVCYSILLRNNSVLKPSHVLESS